MSHPIMSAIAGEADAVLHRVQAEDGLDMHVGRLAVLRLLAAWRGGAEPQVTHAGGDARTAFLCLPGVHFWARVEAGRIAELTVVRDRPAGDDAEAFGRARPCHRPLGELLSGRGQLAPETDQATASLRWAGRFNSRDPAMEGRPIALLQQAPDAVLLPLVECPVDGDAVAARFRMLGHIRQRRISLPVSAVISEARGTLAFAVDGLALAATGYRPFWPA